MAIVGPHPWEGLAAKALPIGSGPAKQKTNLPWVDHATGTRPDTRAPTPAPRHPRLGSKKRFLVLTKAEDMVPFINAQSPFLPRPNHASQRLFRCVTTKKDVCLGEKAQLEKEREV